jgi:hypothetical protein
LTSGSFITKALVTTPRGIRQAQISSRALQFSFKGPLPEAQCIAGPFLVGRVHPTHASPKRRSQPRNINDLISLLNARHPISTHPRVVVKSRFRAVYSRTHLWMTRMARSYLSVRLSNSPSVVPAIINSLDEVLHLIEDVVISYRHECWHSTVCLAKFVWKIGTISLL